MSVTANLERGETLVTLGGSAYKLRPTFAAIAEIRKESAVPLGVSMQRIVNLDAVEGAIVLGAIMRANGHKFTNDQIGDMLVAGGLQKTLQEIGTLLANMLTGGSEPGAMGEATATAGTAKSPSVATPA